MRCHNEELHNAGVAGGQGWPPLQVKRRSVAGGRTRDGDGCYTQLWRCADETLARDRFAMVLWCPAGWGKIVCHRRDACRYGMRCAMSPRAAANSHVLVI